jgi:hypothetical protein
LNVKTGSAEALAHRAVSAMATAVRIASGFWTRGACEKGMMVMVNSKLVSDARTGSYESVHRTRFLNCSYIQLRRVIIYGLFATTLKGER